MIKSLFLVSCFLFLVSQARAAEYSAGDACTEAGAMHVKNDSTGASYLTCDGSVWQLGLKLSKNGRFALNMGTGVSSVAGFDAGTYSYLGAMGGQNTLRFTDGNINIYGYLKSIASAGTFSIGTINNGVTDTKLSLSSGSTTYAKFWFNSTEGVTITSDTFVGINNTSPSVALDVTGDIEYSGVITDVSDRRLKENIVSLEPALDKIMGLKPVSFTMKDDDEHKTEYGFIAQEVEPLYPVLVQEDNQTGMKSLNYVGMIAPLIKAVQEQNDKIDSLVRENELLAKRLETLENR